PPPAATAPAKTSLSPALAIGAVAVAIALGAGAWFVYQLKAADGAKTGLAATASNASSAAPVSNPPASALSAAARPEAGTLVISALGLIDPSDPRYQSDKTLLQSDLRADSKGQLVAKAAGFLLDTN